LSPDPDPAARLKEVAILVTGGGSGIGRASSLRLAAEGARVLVTDRNPASAQAVAEEISSASGTAFAGELDVAGEEVEPTLQRLVGEHLGQLDALVNNAGIGTAGTILETRDEDWRQLFAVNVDGVFRCTRAALPAMLERGSGSIVNIASVAGLVGLTNRYAYCASKGAVVSMTRATALDYADTGVRVNCICPGTIDTPWVDARRQASPDSEAFDAEMSARQPVGRLGTAEEVAAAVAYLCSSDAEFVTGSAMLVDGGLTAGIPKPR